MRRPAPRRVRLALSLAAATLLSTLPGAGVPLLVAGESAAAAPRPGPAAAPAPAPSCGTTVTKANGTPWVCSFADEFSGTKLDTQKWLPITTAANGFTNGGECFKNSTNNIQVSGGSLRLTVRKEAVPFSCASPYGAFKSQYTGGYVATWDRFQQTYGRYEIRAKFPSQQMAGLQTALWLYPRNLTYGAWPASGEIDIAEFYTTYPDRAIPYLHYTNAESDANVTNNYCMITKPDDFHTYTLEWLPGSMTISYDGQVCLATTSWNPDGLAMPAPFDQPFFLNLTQALGNGANPFDATTTSLPATTYVDYVHVWR